MIEINHDAVFGLFHTIVEQTLKKSDPEISDQLTHIKDELSKFFGEEIDFKIVEDDPSWS